MCYILIVSKVTKNKPDQGCAQFSEHRDALSYSLTQAYLWEHRSVFILTFWNRSLCNANVGYDGQGAATEDFGGKEEGDVQGA